MNKVYLNMKTGQGVETVDEFTQGQDAPINYREFRAYVRDMVREYHIAGMAVYRSTRCTNEWRKK